MGSRTPSSVPGVFLQNDKQVRRDREIEKKNSRSVTGQEVVAGLFRRELAHRRKNTESVAGQHDDVLRLRIDRTRNPGIGDVLDRVRASCVLGDADIVVVWYPGVRVVDDVLEDRTEADGVEDLGLLLGGEVDALGVAAALDVEDTSVGPDVLVVTNEETVRVSGEGVDLSW